MTGEGRVGDSGRSLIVNRKGGEFRKVFCAADAATLQRADQDEAVVNRLGGARGALAGITVGALLWAGIILAGAALIKR